ncbi:MAG: endolytic transglycosylase MltG [Bacilli bacterium]|jgi:cell division protein YceG involved in septum cleavage
MKRFRDLAIFLFFSLGLAIIIVGSMFKYYLSPVSNDTTEREFIITEEESINKIVTMLYEQDLIRNPKVFKLYLQLNNISKMKVGLFKLNSHMSSQTIIYQLTGK